SPGHRIGQHDLLLRQVGHAELHPPPLLAQIIIRRVHGQAVQPGFKDLRRTKLIERKIQPEENLLSYILHIFRTSDQARDRAYNPFSISQYDFVKGCAIAFLGLSNLLEINQHAVSKPASSTSL